ncbi:RNA polymerase sigma factor [Hyphococcus luteus]|uniref:RNA polymerase sigma factor 70 region 4 type 2 domain-containing protein n=1 Tax=Hyphococcus luteus TaxID=2058213 RepID=A0A2S7K076_9PROT|nr:sigma-70 family RNA polymerase sigma factor [Marinicaulis flavus]PQA85876.1 hypothetical protein CW354_20305 [Marinicaulis flavus]
MTDFEPPDIPPLRKVKNDGSPYVRQPQIESRLPELLSLPLEAFSDRALIKNRRDPDYIPSEILMHRLRRCRRHNSNAEFDAIFSIVSERIKRACPKAETRIEDKPAEISHLAAILEQTLDRFTELVLLDRQDYEERLDIFEAVFDRAVVTLRHSAIRKVMTRQKPLAPLEYDESGDVPAEVEESLDFLGPQSLSPEEELTYRFQVRAAIDSLPEEERRVIEMQEAGIQDESKDEDTPSISRIIGRTPKTVRAIRSRAIKKLREKLGIEVHHDV